MTEIKFNTLLEITKTLEEYMKKKSMMLNLK